MPTIVSSNNSSFSSIDISKKDALTKSSSSINQLEKQLEKGSVKAAVELSSLIPINHEDDCHQCNKIANYFIIAYHSLKVNQQRLVCNSVVLALIQQTIELIQSHPHNNSTWFAILSKELRDVGKRVKDESLTVDRYIPLPLPSDIELTSSVIPNDSIEEQYGRAMRISIYHCRATTSEQIDASKSLRYYRKCLSVLPSQFDYNRLQQSAKLNLQRLISEEQKCKSGENKVSSPTRTFSTISSSSSSSISSAGLSIMTCTNCGTEKKHMPVCSKCKSQPYCSIRCLKTHKPVHDLECH